MSGECVISSVLFHHNKDLKQWTKVLQLGYSSLIQQVKKSMPLRHEGGSAPKEKPQPFLPSTFYTFVSSPQPQACSM